MLCTILYDLIVWSIAIYGIVRFEIRLMSDAFDMLNHSCKQPLFVAECSYKRAKQRGLESRSKSSRV